MQNSYTDRQIEAANLLRAAGEGVTSEVADELITMVGEAERRSPDSSAPQEQTELQIRMQLLNETDWRKRAALSAMLISKSFDY